MLETIDLHASIIRLYDYGGLQWSATACNLIKLGLVNLVVTVGKESE